MLKKAGFEVKIVNTGWIPFDPECRNWWVRGPIRTLLYAIRQTITGISGR
ncbi:MAG: hypothetical protein HYV76_00820 [Candidatus Vogelbacteria bacterium]|nr:hypothetical protein [Candidatus Vogelbacteria bacterium]